MKQDYFPITIMLEKSAYDTVAGYIKKEHVTIGNLFIKLFNDYLNKPTTGRGHRDTDAENKVKKFMRQHCEGVTACEVARHLDISQARAARILDNLSVMGEDNEFLIYADDELDEPLYFIFKDDEEVIC